MAIERLRFVDSIAASPTVLFDLNDRVNTQLQGFDWGVPDLDQQIVSNLALDGGTVPVSAYGMRRPILEVLFSPTSRDHYAQLLQTLGRILDKPMSLLEWQPAADVSPIFWRILRSPQHSLLDLLTRPGSKPVTLRLLAEPFALGLPVTPINAAAVSKDPSVAIAAGVGGQVLHFTVTGDVPTPAQITISGALTGKQVIAVRRHGDVTAVTRSRQCEAMTAQVDTAIQANDPLMSGAGQNYLRTTFTTTPAMTTRLSDSGLTGSVDSRGIYRVFARVRRSAAVSVITVRTRVGTAPIYGPTRTLPQIAGIFIVDLGLISIPGKPEPKFDGYGAELIPTVPQFQIEAARASGAETLGWDYLSYVPADEEMCITDTAGSPTSRYYDGPNDIVWSSADVPMARAGAIPQLAPGITNQIRIVEPVGVVGDLSNSTVTVKYWPRYLHAST